MRLEIPSAVQMLRLFVFTLLLFAIALFVPSDKVVKQPATSVELTDIHELASEVKTIEIYSGWAGFGGRAQTQLTISRSGGGFVRNRTCWKEDFPPRPPGDNDNKSQNKPNKCPEKNVPVSDALVAALLRALRAPIVKKPSLAAAGVDQASLYELARRECAGESKAGHCFSGSSRQKEFYKRSLTDLVQAQRFFETIFNSWRADDHPGASVVVQLTNGRKIEFMSDSYQPLMLPWKINCSDTYNGRISQALAALMPANACNRDRLLVEALEEELADQASSSIESQWNEIGAEEESGSALRRLRSQYRTAEAEVNEYHGFDFGVEWDSTKTEHERNLHVTLHRSSWPANMSLRLTLRKRASGVEGVDDFLVRAPAYTQKLLSLSWLRKYFEQHSDQQLVLRYVNDASFGEKALRVFAADMRALGRATLAADAESHRRAIVFFTVVHDTSRSNWLLIPDNRLILWRYEGRLPIINWKPENFSVSECAGYPFNDGGCPGAVVSPSGTLLDDMVRSPLKTCMSPEAYTQFTAAQAARKGRQGPLFSIRQSYGEQHGIESYYEGYIDASGRVVLPPILEDAGDFYEGRASFSCGGRWGFLDDELNVVVPPKFGWAEDFSEGLARVLPEGDLTDWDARWGFMDRQGTMVIEPIFKRPIFDDNGNGNFHDGLAQVSSQNGIDIDYIDKRGKRILVAFSDLSSGFHEGLAAAASSKNKKYGYVDKAGRWVIPPQYSMASNFSEGIADVETKHECCYIDATGKVVLRWAKSAGKQDCLTGDFHEGLAVIEKNGKVGFIDKSGDFVIKPQFDKANSFHEGFAAVYIGDRATYIDRSGRPIFKPRAYDHVDDFHNGLVHYFTKEGSSGYIDTTGRVVWEEKKPRVR